MTSESDSRKWWTWRLAVTLAVGALAFVCFTVAGFLCPGGGYNPFLQMLSALGRTEVRGVEYPLCHFWFMAGMFLSAASMGMVWSHLARNAHGWRRHVIGWGGSAPFSTRAMDGASGSASEISRTTPVFATGCGPMSAQRRRDTPAMSSRRASTTERKAPRLSATRPSPPTRCPTATSGMTLGN